MKRNTYTLNREGVGTIALQVCLGIRNGKKFDHGIGHRVGDLIQWKGTYSDNQKAWELLISRCYQLHNLGVVRDKKAETQGIK